MLRRAYDRPHVWADRPARSFISISCDSISFDPAKYPTKTFWFFNLLRASGIALALIVSLSAAVSQT
jgi:hypothetical protein